MTERLKKIIEGYNIRTLMVERAFIDYIEELERTDEKALEVIKAMDALNKQNADRLKEIEELEKENKELKDKVKFLKSELRRPTLIEFIKSKSYGA